MESTRPIRSLTRGLDALTMINSRDGVTVSQIAHAIRLPRTTAYRILETLCDAGYACRGSFDDRYRVTVLVRALSAGFADEEWVRRIARPRIAELGRQILWPVSLATLSGSAMILRETTDHATPLPDTRQSAGHRNPLLESAAGRTYLAFCPAEERDNLLDQLARSNCQDPDPSQSLRPELLRILGEIRTQGYGTLARPRGPEDEVTVSVPVRAQDRVWGALTVRFMSGVVPLKSGLERFLPKLHQCAAEIGTSLSENLAPAQSNSAPHEAV